MRESVERVRKAEQKKREQQTAIDNALTSKSTTPTQNPTDTKESTPQRRVMRRHTMLPSKFNATDLEDHSSSATTTNTTSPATSSTAATVVATALDKKKSGDVASALRSPPNTDRRASDISERAIASMSFSQLPRVASNGSMDLDREENVSSSSAAYVVIDSNSAQATSSSVPPESATSTADPGTLNNSGSIGNDNDISVHASTPAVDPNDRAAMLKEALAKRGMQRRKSSIM